MGGESGGVLSGAGALDRETVGGPPRRLDRPLPLLSYARHIGRNNGSAGALANGSAAACHQNGSAPKGRRSINKDTPHEQPSLYADWTNRMPFGIIRPLATVSIRW